MSEKLCDKCHRPVEDSNDAVFFDMFLTTDPEYIMVLLFAGSRHLLPVIDTDTGAVLCEGSPSRAQYLPGQPHDTRAEWAYDEKKEAMFRAAYREMQSEIKRLSASLN